MEYEHIISLQDGQRVRLEVNRYDNGNSYDTIEWSINGSCYCSQGGSEVTEEFTQEDAKRLMKFLKEHYNA